MISKNKMIAFEKDIKKCFERGEIRAPIHLSGGNEDQLRQIFRHIRKDDWVFSTHRSHYHALLKGIPPEWIKEQILQGHSMHLMNREYNFFTSSIVAACCPIAVGVARVFRHEAITILHTKRRHVWVFVGDMAATTGIFDECCRYALRHRLPITWVVEDNGMSTNTPTQKVWGVSKPPIDSMIKRYEYKRVFPHINTGKWVELK